MDKLKKCPFCGGTGCLNANYSYKTRSYFTFVKCNLCGAQAKIYSSEDDPAATDWQNAACQDACNAWNLRTGET